MEAASLTPLRAGRTPAGALRFLSDRQLVRLTARGDSRAFGTIYERYHRELYRYCHSLTGDREDAGDALQSTMASALSALRGETREIALRSWLFRIAHNQSVSLLRKRRPHAELAQAEHVEQPGPHRQLALHERLGRLLVDLRDLPESQRGALLLRELSGLEYDEIGAALEISPGAARQAVYQARRALYELEDGRNMACDAARRSLSARDRRILRGRRLRAHLRSCDTCSAFRDEISARRAALRALVPTLPAAMGSAIIGGLVGASTLGSGAAVGTTAAAGGSIVSLAGTGAGQVGGFTAVKGGAAVAVALVAAVGGAKVAAEHDSRPVPAPGPPAAAAQHRAPVAGRPSLAALPSPAGRSVPPQRAARGPADSPSLRRRARHDDLLGPVRRPLRRVTERLPRLDPPQVQLPRVRLPQRAQPPTPTPAPRPAPAPVTRPWQQSYATSIERSRTALQQAGQVYNQSMALTQQLLSRFLPRRR